MAKARAQAQAQQIRAISSTESYQLVQCLIRVSVYHVCWMRGLFPEVSFSAHDLKQLDNLHIKMLKPSEHDDEATTLQQWVEKGVMDAVQHGYLKNMYFGISQDAGGTNLLEEYIYSFKYGEDGIDFEMDAVGAKGKKKDKYSSKDGKRRVPPNVDAVRYQVVRLMRMLVQVCQTLDQVPDERYLFIKLTYHDHTPNEYEPPHFHAVAEEGIGHFSRRPFSMEVGGMDTRHHTVSLRVKSVLDSCGDNVDEDDEMQELEGSQQVSGMLVAGDGDGATGGDDQQLQLKAGNNDPKLHTEEAMRLLVATEPQMDDNTIMDMEDGPGGANPPPPRNTTKPDVNAPDTPGGSDPTQITGEDQQQHPQAAPDSQEECGEAYERVRSYCLQRQAVSYMDVMGCFYDISGSQLQLVFDGLQREGLLQAGSTQDTYYVVQPGQGTANDHTTAPAVGLVANNMDMEEGCGSGGPPCKPSAAAPAAAPAAAINGYGTQQQYDMLMGSQMDPLMESQMGDKGMVAAAHGQMDAQQQQDQILSKMTGLSVGGAAAAAQRVVGVDGSVFGNCTTKAAGSDASGQPFNPAAMAPPSAAGRYAPPTAADEPSVQLPADQLHSVWFDASQQSYVAPLPAAGAATAAAGQAQQQLPGQGMVVPEAATVAGADGRRSRLRKASYVDKPIYQHAGKQRAAAAKSAATERQLHQTAGKVVRKGANSGSKSGAGGKKGGTAGRFTAQKA